MKPITVGFALTGSYCTFERIFPVMQALVDKGYRLVPIMSEKAYTVDTRFGTAREIRDQVREICQNEIIHDTVGAEPIGPQGLLDVLVVAPCTGNSLAKIAAGISDTSVTMASKSHRRNGKPVIIALSTNDALSGNAKNIGTLMGSKNIYFVPFKQDDPLGKPFSMVAEMELIPETVAAALEGRQLQPILYGSE